MTPLAPVVHTIRVPRETEVYIKEQRVSLLKFS